MAPGADPAFQQAMDKLMLQVNGDNVLTVHTAFQGYANELRQELNRIRNTSKLGLCGLDPVSHEVLKGDSIDGKVGQLLAVHWLHWEELSAVAENLRETARKYGHTEEEVTASFPKTD